MGKYTKMKLELTLKNGLKFEGLICSFMRICIGTAIILLSFGGDNVIELIKLLGGR